MGAPSAQSKHGGFTRQRGEREKEEARRSGTCFLGATERVLDCICAPLALSPSRSTCLQSSCCSRRAGRTTAPPQGMQLSAGRTGKQWPPLVGKLFGAKRHRGRQSNLSALAASQSASASLSSQVQVHTLARPLALPKRSAELGPSWKIETRKLLISVRNLNCWPGRAECGRWTATS